MVHFPNAKINLGLRVLAKREDGYHNLETVFYPVAVRDAIEVVEGGTDIEFTQSGHAVAGDPEKNLCLKAYRMLKQDYPPVPPCKIHLHKAIPERGGLGGGSADGSFTLMLLNKKFRLGIEQKKLQQYALQLGSDCPFFILNRPCHATGRGEILEPVTTDLSSYHILIVNPGISIETGKAFSMIPPAADDRLLLKDALQQPVEKWKDHVFNDFEAYAFHAFPEIADIKEKMYRAGALYASLSGSGSSVYGIFRERRETSFPPGYFQKWV